MSVQMQIDRISANISQTYSVLSDAGADIPETANSDNLPDTARSIKAVLYDRTQNLTGEQKAQARENIGAQPAGNYALKTEIPSVPVQSVNGKTGAVSLTATDVKARPDSWMPTASDVGAAKTSHTHAAEDVSRGTFNSDRLPTVPISKGGTGATTAAKARAKLGITPANIGAMDASKLITVYNVNIALTNGVGTYSNSNITSSSRCFAQRRVGVYMSGLQSIVGTESKAGAVTVVMDTNITGNIQANIIIFN